MYSLHQQYLDMASGFHVIELRDERGNRRRGYIDCAIHGSRRAAALKPVGICPLRELGGSDVEESARIEIFDGHNDAVQHIAEYRRGGRDFLTRSDDGHLDLPRAREGGLVGGLFAMFAKPERGRPRE